ncbi:hypothetical protein [Clostridium botulinum]|uniref:Uncharacterized protein n=1 Tax=Clostridium botulinum (strain Langeland / NCTC 10281 / Type F) TaxID=441772 RepID=A7GAZ4_CLOBL|nr:hypothetical protein [Clostridium botulinum]ABS40745.1 hypothetical protein CLI_0670 [Clostridium botulinum F str. Langeland]ADF98416.1 hypothetical protein CBF_0639 [Clostridium botulinum F str. 230613]
MKKEVYPIVYVLAVHNATECIKQGKCDALSLKSTLINVILL